MIPIMDDPLSKYWEQPKDMTDVVYDDNHALLDQRQVEGLLEYSRSRPSGVYPGKCWKAQDKSGAWYLCWYGPDSGDGLLANFVREIIVVPA